MSQFYLHPGVSIRNPRTVPDIDGFIGVDKDWVLDRSTDRDYDAKPVGWALLKDDVERDVSEEEFVKTVEALEGPRVMCRLYDGLFLNYWIVKI